MKRITEAYLDVEHKIAAEARLDGVTAATGRPHSSSSTRGRGHEPATTSPGNISLPSKTCPSLLFPNVLESVNRISESSHEAARRVVEKLRQLAPYAAH